MSEYTSNPNSLTGGPFGTTAATTNTGFFTDKTNPSSVNCNALPEPSSNVVAASGKWAGGQRRRHRRHKKHSKRRSRKSRGRRHRTRRYGGTTNNVPNTPTYATGTELPYGLSALAMPAPYWKLTTDTNCADNYNRFTGGRKRRHKSRRNRSSKRRHRSRGKKTKKYRGG